MQQIRPPFMRDDLIGGYGAIKFMRACVCISSRHLNNFFVLPTGVTFSMCGSAQARGAIIKQVSYFIYCTKNILPNIPAALGQK